jgi:hypothetical protein
MFLLRILRLPIGSGPFPARLHQYSPNRVMPCQEHLDTIVGDIFELAGAIACCGAIS